ncbi:uncharacterized protein [Nicotiana sylvestris]|uniref:uncharacterized protein n=1 Tax=Nicotiana sylvestris TaxID=4096 RepID=UPI00388C70E9
MSTNGEVDDNQTFAESVDQVGHHHPLYIHLSDTQGFVLISIQLQGAENYSIWSRSLKIVLHVLAWTMNIVAPNLISIVIYASDAYTVRDGLRERFDKVNASRAAYLHKEIVTLTQGFLTVLNDSYENAKNQVLMTRPLPNLNQAYAMIINVESQRITGKSVYGSNDNNEVAAMISNRSQNGGHNGGSNNFGGHTKENCFKLHGYPSDFKNKRRGGGFNAQANNVNNNMNHIEKNYGNLPSETQGNQLNCATPTQFFTLEQYQQILQMLSRGKDTELVANSATTETAIILHAFMSTLVDHNWIVNTGASNHMVHSLNLLESYEEVSEKDKNKVQLPTGEQASITHTGIYFFFRNKKIQNILHIPDFKYNLLSVSKITKELRCLVAFFLDFCVFRELFSGKGYILYDLQSKGFFVSRDVVFKEDIFPFKNMQLGASLLFPILEFTDAQIEKSIGQPVSISDLPTPGIQQVLSHPSPLYGIHSEPSPSIPPSAPSVSPEGLRRSSRPSKPPIWLTDYVVHPKKITCHYFVSQHSLVDLPQGKVPIGCKWVFKVKYKSNGEVVRYKARLLAKCYSQQEGLDYTETFSPMAKMVTVRAVVALAAASSWYIFQMDVHNAFLQGDHLEEVHMQVPDGFSSQGQIKRIGVYLVVILLYMDDLLVTGSNLFLIQQVRKDLQEKFKMKDLGELKYFLGIEFSRS